MTESSLLGLETGFSHSARHSKFTDIKRQLNLLSAHECSSVAQARLQGNTVKSFAGQMNLKTIQVTCKLLIAKDFISITRLKATTITSLPPVHTPSALHREELKDQVQEH